MNSVGPFLARNVKSRVCVYGAVAVAVAVVLMGAWIAAGPGVVPPTVARWRAGTWPVPMPDSGTMAPAVADALEETRRAVEEDPSSHGAWFDHAATLHAHALHRSADEAYRRAGQLRPDDPRVPYLRALIGPGIGLEVEARLALLERAAEMDPRYPPTWLRIGEALADAGRLEEAEGALRRAVALDPSYPMAHRQLGLVDLELGDVAGAMLHLEFAAELVPDDYPTWAGLARALQRAGRDREAERAAERSEPLIAVMNYRDGVLNDVLGRGVGPLRMDDLARSYERAGAWRQAIEALKLLERSRPDAPDVQRRLVAAYEALGEKALAEIHRRRAERFDDP